MCKHFEDRPVEQAENFEIESLDDSDLALLNDLEIEDQDEPNEYDDAFSDDLEEDFPIYDDLDGDHATALASAGFGTDEDYRWDSFEDMGTDHYDGNY